MERNDESECGSFPRIATFLCFHTDVLIIGKDQYRSHTPFGQIQ